MGKRYVCKIGSLGVSEADGGLSRERIASLSADLLKLMDEGHEVVLVSSGAINTGRSVMKDPGADKRSLTWKQACAAIGMPLLMDEYRHHMKPRPVAQILLTHEDFKSRPRFLNVRNTILSLLQNGILPVVNENDTISTSEITVGDNDQLAAMVAEAIDADLLVLLTESDGLYDRDPREAGAQHIPLVDFREDFANIKLKTTTSVGRGGMLTKLQAIRRLTPLGQDVVIASFNFPSPLLRALQDNGGTRFKGDPREKVKKRKAWIATIARMGCQLIVDEGAAKALSSRGSLLPVGIKKVKGTFKRGEAVAVMFQRKIIAVGISEYDSGDVETILGKRSGELPTLLGKYHSDTVIHRNNLFITDVKDKS